MEAEMIRLTINANITGDLFDSRILAHSLAKKVGEKYPTKTVEVGFSHNVTPFAVIVDGVGDVVMTTDEFVEMVGN